MFELLLCSMLTVLPDYLFRRYAQGKRIGRDITLYSVWFELRWGIISCLLLTISLITLIFYFHPATQSAVSLFRTVPILPEGGGRVAEVYVGVREEVEAGQPLFKLDSSEQEAALNTARQRIQEIEAGFELAQADLEAAEGRIVVAEGAYKQALEELETRSELRQRNADTVPARQIEQLQVRSGTQRVADFLLKLCPVREGSAVVALPYDKSLLASRLGMKPEGFSRALARLRELRVRTDRDHVPGSDVRDLTGWNVAGEVRAENFELRGEYLETRQEIETTTGFPTFKRDGFYAQAAYRAGAFEPLFRWTQVFDGSIDGTTQTEGAWQAGFGLDYWFNPSIAVMAGFELNREDGPEVDNDRFVVHVAYGF